MVVISDLASLCLKDEVPPNASVETAALLAWITEGPEICTHHTSIARKRDALKILQINAQLSVTNLNGCY